MDLIFHSFSTEAFDRMSKCIDTYFVTVIEDTSCGKIVGSATLLLEQKFIHNCAMVRRMLIFKGISKVYVNTCRMRVAVLLQRGRVEDVVVSDEYRGRQLGKL